MTAADNVRVDVVSALAAVAAEMPNIGKDSRASQQQGGYAYRGIEAIVGHAAPLLAKHGIVFVPQVTACEVRDITVNNKPWTDTILTVRYRICGPGGTDDYVEACVIGIGRDNADKGANKALTQAFKYALIQTLCIADGKDDGDAGSVEADARPDPVLDGWESNELAREAHAALADRIAALPEDARAAVRAVADGWPLPKRRFDDVEATVRVYESGSEPF